MANFEAIDFSGLQGMENTTLGSLITHLMQHCEPPQRRFPLWQGVPPPWWPTGSEEWINSRLNLPKEQIPYDKPHNLGKKSWRVCVLVAIIRNLLPDLGKIRRPVMRARICEHMMNAEEHIIWKNIVGRPSYYDVKVIEDETDSDEDFDRTKRKEVHFNRKIGRFVTPSTEDETSECDSDFMLEEEPVLYDYKRNEIVCYTCAHPRCPFSIKMFGFPNIRARNNHQLVCFFREGGYYSQ